MIMTDIAASLVDPIAVPWLKCRNKLWTCRDGTRHVYWTNAANDCYALFVDARLGADGIVVSLSSVERYEKFDLDFSWKGDVSKLHAMLDTAAGLLHSLVYE